MNSPIESDEKDAILNPSNRNVGGAPEPKKPFYKQPWFFAALAALAIIVIGLLKK